MILHFNLHLDAKITKASKSSNQTYHVKPCNVKHFKNIKNATGLDNLLPVFLKDIASVISQPLCHIINLSVTTGVVPTEWKTAKITPILKSGSSDEVDNYRPISVLPVLSKILERFVHTQLMEYLEKNSLLSSKQFGYRKKRSTEIAITIFVDNVRKAVDNGNLVGAVYIDFSKAFDTIVTQFFSRNYVHTASVVQNMSGFVTICFKGNNA